MRVFGVGTPLAVVTVCLLLVLSIPTNVQADSNSPGSSGLGLATSLQPIGPNQTVGLTIDDTSFNLTNYFWGTTVQPRVSLFRDEGTLVNATPTQIVVWPGAEAGETLNPLNNSIFVSGVRDGVQFRWTPALTSEAQFVAWCKSINCTAIFQVPGEIDNASFAAEIVDYTVNTLHFQPKYWEVGNEPELWKHWNESWNDWPNGNPSTPTPINYAIEVIQYYEAMKVIDPAIQFIGIPATGRPNSQYPPQYWFGNVTRIDGPVLGPALAAESFHEYPGGRQEKLTKAHDYSLQAYYLTLDSENSLAAHVNGPKGLVPVIQQNESEYCPKNCSIQFFVTELGAALSHSPFGEKFGAGFGGTLVEAVSIIQAINLGRNVSNVDLFSAVSLTNNSWFSTTGSTRPIYNLYSQIFPHLGAEAFPVNISDQNLNWSVFGTSTLAPHDDNRSDLLVVNTNLTTAATFSPRLPGNIGTNPAEIWQWNGSLYGNTDTVNVRPDTLGPVEYEDSGGLPSTFTLPPQSLVLFESYPRMVYPVTLQRTGYDLRDPNGNNSRWFGEVNGQLFATNSSTYTALFPNGPVAISAMTVPLPVGTNLTYPIERAEPFVGASRVEGSALTVPINFVVQTRLIVHSSPEYGGTVSPASPWTNLSEPVNLTATPSPGWLFNRWFGWNVTPPPNTNFTALSTDPSLIVTNSTSPTIEIEPNDSDIGEEANFSLGFPVAFAETGLSPSIPWSATVDGLQSVTLSGTTPAARFLEANGTWGFTINAPSGYIAHPSAGAIVVNGSSALVAITFARTATPPPEFGVTFVETGLPTGTSWTVTSRGVTTSVSSSSFSFSAPNGTFGYSVQSVPGYRAPQADGSYTVSGMPTTVTISFQNIQRLTYPVSWSEQGLPTGTDWSVWIQPHGSHGVNLSTTDPSITYAEPNGTIGYRVSFLANYRPHVGNLSGPANDSVNVTGAPASVSIVFQETGIHALRVYTVLWNETGLWNVTSPKGGSTPAWTVELWGPSFNFTTFANNGTTVLARSGAAIGLPNGTYSYAVPYVDGFVPQPATGTFQVLGAPTKNQTAPIDLRLHFARPIPVFSVSVHALGLPSDAAWQIRLSNRTFTTTLAVVALGLTDGRYSFDVADPPGYFPVPSHGNITVANATVMVTITFEPSQPPPPPSIWVVAPKVLGVLGIMLVAGWGMFSLLGLLSRQRSGAKR